MGRKMGERQRWAWLAGGLSAAVAICGCGLGWLWILLGGAVVSLYYIYMDANLPGAGLAKLLPKPVAILTLIWIIVLLAWSANLADSAFPMVKGFPVLGWTMLALAAWGSYKGAGVCAGCAGILCLFLIILYSIVVIFGLPDAELRYLEPYGKWQNGLWSAGLFLLPAAVWYLPCRKSRKGAAWIVGVVPLVTAVVLTMVTAGVLSPYLAASLPSPLYTLAQSISLFGVVERIEPLLSAAMTMGVFCLLSAMACTCRELSGKKWGGMAACGAAGVLMGVVGKLGISAISAGCGVVFLVVPLVLVSTRKNYRKKAKIPVDKGE